MPFRSVTRRSSEFGSNRGGWGAGGEIVNSENAVTNSAVDITFAFSGGNPTSGYTVTIQLLRADGTPIAHQVPLDIIMFTSAAMTALAVTGGTTGLGGVTAGLITATITAKKFFKVLTDATGKFVFTWTDTAHEVVFAGVKMPNGYMAVSPALTTA